MSRSDVPDTPLTRAPVSAAPDLMPVRRPKGEAPRLVALPRTGLEGEVLVQGLVQRDPAAVAELFDRHSARVRRTLVRALGSDADADDLAQETFLIVLRRVADLRDPEALQSFVLGIAIRVAKNELRKRTLRRFVGLEQLELVPAQPEHDPVAHQAMRRLYAVLDRFSATARLLLILRHVEGLELAELAQAFDCSLATIKRRLARAEAQLEANVARDPALSAYLGRDR